MKEAIVRLTLDLFYTACYIFLVHTGYNISDRISSNEKNIFVYTIIWVIASVVMFFLTKQRYDKEVEEGKQNDES